MGLDRKGENGEGSSGGVKRRFDDTEYLEQSRDIVDNVKSAVVAGMSIIYTRSYHYSLTLFDG